MAGSRKGEHRGNARKKPVTHDTPNDVMTKALKARTTPRKRKRGERGQGVSTVEQQIFISRVINGDSGRVRDMTPKEIMADSMWHFMQAAVDYEEMWRRAAMIQPPTVASLKAVEIAEREIERNRLIARECARDVAPFIHPKLSAIALAGENLGVTSQLDVVEALMDEIDKRSRQQPLILEHAPRKKVGS